MGLKELPGRLWSGVTRAFLATSTALHVVAAGLSAKMLVLLSQVESGGMGAVLAASTHEQVHLFLKTALVASYALVPVVAGLQLHRAHKNLALLGVRDVGYRPGTAITMWWVPGFNLVMPVLFGREVQRASSGKTAPLHTWALLWGAFLVGGAQLVARLVMPEPLTLGAMQLDAILDVAGRLMSAAGLFAGLVVVRAVDGKQQDVLVGQSVPPMARLLGHTAERIEVPSSRVRDPVRS